MPYAKTVIMTPIIAHNNFLCNALTSPFDVAYSYPIQVMIATVKNKERVYTTGNTFNPKNPKIHFSSNSFGGATSSLLNGAYWRIDFALHHSPFAWDGGEKFWSGLTCAYALFPAINWTATDSIFSNETPFVSPDSIALTIPNAESATISPTTPQMSFLWLSCAFCG